MICPNPNCKSVIPDDSKFCPDCGTLIKNVASLRMEAKNIVNEYPKGYEALVKSGILPSFSDFLAAEGYEFIILKKNDIIKKEGEICNNSLNISHNSIFYENHGMYFNKVTVNSTCICKVNVDSSWIHLGDFFKPDCVRYINEQTITNGEISIHVDKNTGNRRTGYVCLSNGYVQKKITIIQNGGYKESSGCMILMLCIIGSFLSTVFLLMPIFHDFL